MSLKEHDGHVTTWRHREGPCGNEGTGGSDASLSPERRGVWRIARSKETGMGQTFSQSPQQELTQMTSRL